MDAEGVPSELVEQMHKAEALTANNKRLILFIAFNYGGRAEILDAAKRFTGGSEAEFRACLYAPEMHDPDIIIRTGARREAHSSRFLKLRPPPQQEPARVRRDIPYHVQASVSAYAPLTLAQDGGGRTNFRL